MPGTWVLLLLSYGFLITSLQIKSQTLHFITEEIEVQRWEVVCTPHGKQVQGQAPLTWGLGLKGPNHLHSSFRWKLLDIATKLYLCVLVAQSYLTPSDPMDCSPSGFSVHEILQARILENFLQLPFLSPRDISDSGIKSSETPGKGLIIAKEIWIHILSPLLTGNVHIFSVNLNIFTNKMERIIISTSWDFESIKWNNVCRALITVPTIQKAFNTCQLSDWCSLCRFRGIVCKFTRS